ncbi:MAG TPA: hypothetical protein VHX68_10695 [Planctomycetaceae bacterium]|jgi:hypothetical protein|nr:hypothetical protein [Planctomycetaceae bacterium]
MPKCEKCDQDAAMHVTEVHQGTGEVKVFHLCVEHARDYPGCVGSALGKAASDTPMTNPSEHATQFVDMMKKAGCAIIADAECVILTRKDDPKFLYRLDRQKLRPAVYSWLATAGVSRQPKEVNDIVEAIFSLLRRRE